MRGVSPRALGSSQVSAWFGLGDVAVPSRAVVWPAPQWWLRADSLGLNDGDAVSTWTDEMGAYGMTGGGGGTSPTFKTGIVNSLPVVRFDGGDYMTSSASASLAERTIFAVVRPTAATGYQSIVGASGATGGLQLQLDSGRVACVKQGTLLLSRSTGAVSTSLFSVVGITYSEAADLATTRIAGTQTSSAAWTGTLSAGQTTYLGRQLSSEYLTGDIAEVMSWSSALTADEIATVESYLAGKYAL